MGDAYTGSGQMEFDRRDREEAANKIEKAEKLIAKSKDNTKYKLLENKYDKLHEKMAKKEKLHKKEIKKIQDEIWKTLTEKIKIQNKYKS